MQPIAAFIGRQLRHSRPPVRAERVPGPGIPRPPPRPFGAADADDLRGKLRGAGVRAPAKGLSQSENRA